MMDCLSLNERAAFFVTRCGASKANPRESWKRARQRAAMALARAEMTAQDMGIRVQWEPETEPWDGDCEPPELCVCGIAYGPDGRALASLGMVGVDGWDDPMLRVYAAEILMEAIETMGISKGGA